MRSKTSHQRLPNCSGLVNICWGYLEKPRAAEALGGSAGVSSFVLGPLTGRACGPSLLFIWIQERERRARE